MNEKVDAQIRAIKNGLFTIFEELEKIDKTYNELPSEVRAELEIGLTAEALDKLPWNPFNNSFRPGEWIYSDMKGAEALLKAVHNRPEIIIGAFSYHFSRGRDGRTYIVRNPK